MGAKNNECVENIDFFFVLNINLPFFFSFASLLFNRDYKQYIVSFNS